MKNLFCISILFLLTFNIYAQTTCANALTLNVGGACEGAVTINDNTVTAEGYNCGGTIRRERWYKFEITGLRRLRITGVASNMNLALQLLSGPCGSTAQLACINATNTNSAQTETLLTGNLGMGIYYIRVLNVGTNSNMNLSSLCITLENDECLNASTLTVNPTTVCASSMPGTIDGATNSGIAASGACAGSANDDVWYKFVATSSCAGINLSSFSGGQNTNLLNVEVFGGTCGVLGSILSCNGGIGGGVVHGTELSNLTIGNTYFVRVFSQTLANSTFTYNICVNTQAPAPSNDNCTNPSILTVNPSTVCTSVTAGTTTNATNSPTIATSDCGGGMDDDVWYQFTATSASNTISFLNVTGASLSHVVYTINCLSTVLPANTITCSSSNLSSYSDDYIIGNTYFIRVFTGVTSPTSNSFDICVSASPPPPINDECAGAIDLIVNNDDNCGSSLTTSFLRSSKSTELILLCAPSSAFFQLKADLWYKFTATSPKHSVKLNNTDPALNLIFALYDGPCGSLSLLYCNPMMDGNFDDLIIGHEYFIRVMLLTENPTEIIIPSDFTICIGTPPIGPPNDNCLGATNLTVNPDLTCSTSLTADFSNTGFTVSEPLSCINGHDDLWYKFTATSTNHSIAINNIAGFANSISYELISACNSGGWGIINCGTNLGSSGIGFLTIGAEYLVRISSDVLENNQNTSFEICIGTPPTPINDECNNSQNVPVNPNMSCSSSVHGNLLGADASPVSSPPCGNPTTDIWYSFTATQNAHVVEFNNVDNLLYNIPSQYLNFAIYSGNCGSLTFMSCNTNYELEKLITGLVIGNTYFIRVYSFFGGPGAGYEFDLCVGTPNPTTTNVNCNNAINLPINSTNACLSSIAGQNSWNSSTSDGACGSNLDGTWFSFIATDIQHNLEISDNDFDAGVQLFSGTCASLTQLKCITTPIEYLTNLTVGQNYFLKVSTFSSTPNTMDYTLCLTTPPDIPACVPAPIADDNCTSATLINLVGNTSGGLCGTTSNTYSIDPIGNFCQSIENNSWFRFIASESTATMQWWVTGGGAYCDEGAQFQIYSGPCNNLSPLNAEDCIGTTGLIGSNGQFSMTSLTINETYYIMIDGHSGDVCDYVIQLQNGILLPVEFSNFELAAQNETITIKWSTSSERNNDYFQIEKSSNAISWELLGQVDGNGTSYVPHNYDLLDKNPNSGINYYRIKQVDYDGNSNFSNVKNIYYFEKNDYILYPNPAKNEFYIEGENTDELKIEIIDIYGIKNNSFEIQNLNQNKITIKSNKNQGIYFIRLIGEGKEIVKRIVIL